jgi:NADH dehydrogenase [ubiquinone] 1 alpha subcomplex assembly factor 7
MMDEKSLLEAEIRRRIAAAGPMPVGEYMALCLGDPQHGYYTTRDPLGARGDFITAPEISQMFGELIGLWMAAVWKKMHSPDRIHLIELGPGRGTLIKDALRALNVMPGFRETITVHLVEISPVLRAAQEQALKGQPTPVHWHATLADVPRGAAIIVANEFFDAIPINQAVKQNGGWHERRIAVDANGEFGFVVAPDPLPRFQSLLPPALRASPDGAVFEWRDDLAAMEIGRRVANDGGAALVIDYGHVESDVGDTFQAVGKHAYADPLTSPGELDITAHVDFQALRRAIEAIGAVGFGPLEQGEFLRRLGIETRAATLKARATPAGAAEIDQALVRLTGYSRSGMGLLFKAAAFAHRSLGVLPGFDS